MMNYEIAILFCVNKNTLTSEIIKYIIKIIIENNGLIRKYVDLGNLNLYYLIKNQRQANIRVFNIQCEKYVIKKIENKIKYHEVIIRYIIINNQKKNKKNN